MRKLFNVPVLVAVVVLFAFSAGCVFAQGVAMKTGDTEQRINLTLKDAPIKSAIQQIFSGLGYSYSIDDTLQGTVTVRLIDVPFSDALYAILKAGNATMRKEGAVYIFSPRKELSVIPPTSSLVEDIPLQREKRIEKIYVGYVDAAEIAQLLGSGSGGGAGSMSGGRSSGAGAGALGGDKAE